MVFPLLSLRRRRRGGRSGKYISLFFEVYTTIIRKRQKQVAGKQGSQKIEESFKNVICINISLKKRTAKIVEYLLNKFVLNNGSKVYC